MYAGYMIMKGKAPLFRFLAVNTTLNWNACTSLVVTDCTSSVSG